LRVKFYQIYQDLELEEKIVSARAIVNRYQEKDETFKTLYNVFKEYNDNLETPMKQIPNIQLKLTPDLFFLKYKKISHNQFISFRFVLGLFTANIIIHFFPQILRMDSPCSSILAAW